MLEYDLNHDRQQPCPEQMIKDTFKKFVASEQAGGIILLICTVFSLFMANSALGTGYLSIWEIKAGMSLHHWINDGLMAVFFLLAGLEIKREMTFGELAGIKKAALPILAALGGMVVPASIYVFFNHQSESLSGWGIPMATDIAFALGMISLLGNRVPISLKVFLVAVAVVDDMGAIMVIALFYSDNLALPWLAGAAVVLIALLFMNKKGVNSLAAFLLGGVLLWFCILQSGIHATVAGVLLALTIPVHQNEEQSMLHHLEHSIHKPVALLIMPLFALANTGIMVSGNISSMLLEPVSLGIIFGLVLGKPIGIFVFTFLGVKLKAGALPDGVNWPMVVGMGLLGGIGFTMSIFISGLAFNSELTTDFAKISILAGSAMAAVGGLLVLYFTTKPIAEKK